MSPEQPPPQLNNQKLKAAFQKGLTKGTPSVDMTGGILLCASRKETSPLTLAPPSLLPEPCKRTTASPPEVTEEEKVTPSPGSRQTSKGPQPWVCSQALPLTLCKMLYKLPDGSGAQCVHLLSTACLTHRHRNCLAHRRCSLSQHQFFPARLSPSNLGSGSVGFSLCT